MKLKRFAAGFIAAVMAFAVLGTPLGDILPFVRASVATTAGAENYNSFQYKVLSDGTIEIVKYNGSKDFVSIPESIDNRKVTIIGPTAFRSCETVTKVVIPENVICIGNSSFENCVNLTSVIIPNSVTQIGYEAFKACTSLESAIIPGSVVEIGYKAFYFCNSLESVTIPSSVTEIGYEAFSGCKNLKSIDVASENNNYVSVSGILFNKDKTKLVCYPAGKTEINYDVPYGVIVIDDGAFARCVSLTSITIPDSVMRIGGDGFYGCSNLMSITVPDGVASIEGYTFAYCTNLKSITISDSVTSIDYGAFMNCENLTSLIIPEGVTSISSSTFENCSKLVSITIPDGVTSISHDAFRNCRKLVSITIPEGVVSIGREAFYLCTELESITVPISLKWYNIGTNAFLNCNFIKHIHIPNGTTYSDYSGGGELPIKSEYYFELSEYGSCPDENCPMGMHQPDGPIKTSYNLKITDSKGYALKNAIVVCGDKTYDASNGVVHISNPVSTLISVSADGYKSVKVSLNTLSTGSVNTVSLISASSAVNATLSNIYFSEKSNIDMVYDNGSIGTYISTGKATDVLHGVKTIDLKRTSSGHTSYYGFYLYCAGNTSGISSYKVYNGNKLLSSSSSNKIKISTSQLKDNSNLKVVCLLNDGNSLTYNINVKANDNSNDFSSFQLSGDNITLGFSDDLSWLGSSTLSIPNFPLYVKTSGDEVRVGVGVNRDVLDSESGFFNFKKDYEKFKSDLSKNKSYLSAKSLTELKSKYLADAKKSSIPGLKGGIDITIVGCGYAKINNSAEGTTVGFDLVITADFSATYSKQFFVSVVPVVLSIKGGVKLETTIESSISGIGTANTKINADIGLVITPYIMPYAGIGLNKVANVGVYGQLELPINICICNTDKKLQGLNSVDIRGETGFRANFLTMSYNWTLFSGTKNLYTRNQNRISDTISLREEIVNCIPQFNETAVDPALNIDNYTVSQSNQQLAVTENDNGLIAKDVSYLASSDVIVTDELTILASTNSDVSRGVNNQSYVVTSVFKDGKWSNVKAVNDNGYGEYSPKLYKSGNDIFLIYQQATKLFSDDASNSEITDNIGIAVSKFNYETLEFENTNVIYSKDGYNFAPDANDDCTVWVNNTDGSPFGNTENNSIVLYDGTDIKEIKTGIGYIIFAKSGKISDDVYIAYTVDSDGDFGTFDDIQLYVIDTKGGEPMLVDEGCIENFEFTADKYGTLLWTNDERLCYTQKPESSSVIKTDDYISGGFGVLDDNTIYFSEKNATTESSVYLMEYNGIKWSAPYEYYSCYGNIVALSSDGQNILVNAGETDSVTEPHKLYLVKVKKSKDIVLNLADVNSNYLVNSSQIPIDVSLTNNGSETVQTAAFRISDEQMNTINTYTLDNLNIQPGETSECTLLIKPEDNCIGKKIYVTVAEPSDSSVLTDEALDADLENDRTPENNRYGLDFTKSDLEVKTEEYKFGENHSLIFTVLNNTDVVTGGTLKVSDSTGKEILSRHFDDISFNESKIAELDESELVPEGKFSDEITVTVISDNDEYYDYNNTATQWISLTFDEKFDDFSATDINKNGLTLKWDGISQKCGVFIEQLVGDEWKEIATLNDGSVGKYAVSGLTESTKYEFRIRAFKNYGSETGYSECKMLEVSTCHMFGEWQTTVKPTCTEGGEMIRSCSVCGAEETKTIDALGHDYSEQWTVDEEADCVNDGSKSRHCSRCDAKTDVTVIEAKGHTEVVDKAVAATCTADGYTEGKHCSVCNAVIVAQEKIAATGHKYVETVVEPSYSNRGYTLYECSVCGYSYKDNYEEQLIVPAVTGFASGSQTKSSAVLGWDKVSCADGYAVELYTGGKWNEVFRTSDSSVTSCTVGSLKADSIYTLRIRAFKDTDDGTVYSDYTRLAVKTKLAGVTGLKAQGVTATAVKLDWARNAGATGYIIEQYKGGKWTQIAVTKNNYTLTFTVKGLAECTPYSFRVKAYKNDGGKTNYSDYVTVKASTLLGTVKNAKVTSTTGTWITLGWDRNTGATGYVLEQYKGGRWTEIAVTKNNTTLKFTVKGLKNDTTYSFRIKAYKTVGDTTTYGSYVRIVGTTDIPNVAKFTGSAVSASAVKLDWSKNDKATGYVIEQYKGGRWTEIKAVDNDITEITVEGLAKGTAYTFRIKSVKTVDGADKSSEYASVKVKTAE